MRHLTAVLVLALITALPASAEPVLRLINFTADWCPNCRILNPLMAEAMLEDDIPTIERVDLDMTNAGYGRSDLEKANTTADAIRTAQSVKAGYLWDWYGGSTGIAVIIAADNGEPITCLTRNMTVPQMAERIRHAGILTTRRAPGTRKPEGPDCLPPTR